MDRRFGHGQSNALSARLADRPVPSAVRYLCIDLGDKRTGLAVGDCQTRIVSPVEVVEIAVTEHQGKSLVDALVAAARDSGAGALVIGLPLNMDGTEGPRARIVRALAERIAAAAGLPLHYQDERLTSADADWSMARSGMTRGQKKVRRDALAAAAILRDFLAGSGAQGAGGNPGE